MSSLTILLVAAALAASPQPAFTPAKPSSASATLAFVAKDQTLVGTAYGIDAVDTLPRAYGQRLSANISAGQRTVWYSCPGAPQMSNGSRITFEFVAGHHYELVCQAGKDAVITRSDEC